MDASSVRQLLFYWMLSKMTQVLLTTEQKAHAVELDLIQPLPTWGELGGVYFRLDKCA